MGTPDRHLRNLLPCVALALALPAGVAVAEAALPPGLSITERRETYPVEGRTAKALKAELDVALSRRGIEGATAGRTTQRLETHYELAPGPRGCRLADLRVSLDITLHLPDWQPAGGRPRQLSARWDAMLAALTRHEEGHRDIAIATARDLLERLRALPAGLDCDALGREAQRELFRARLRHSIRDQAYERRTNHGIAQGARL